MLRGEACWAWEDVALAVQGFSRCQIRNDAAPSMQELEKVPCQHHRATIKFAASMIQKNGSVGPVGLKFYSSKKSSNPISIVLFLFLNISFAIGVFIQKVNLAVYLEYTG